MVLFVVGIWLAYALLKVAIDLSRCPRSEWRVLAPVILFEQLKTLAFGSAVVLGITWGHSWWQILVYAIGFWSLAMLVERTASEWQRQLRLASRIAPPTDWCMVPAGKVLVRTRQRNALGLIPEHLVVGVFNEGALYNHSSYFIQDLWLEDGQEFDFTGRPVGKTRRRIEPHKVVNRHGKSSFSLIKQPQ